MTDAPSQPRAAVFLDRDGTLIVDRGYLAEPDGVEFLPGALEGLRRLAQAGFPLVIASNQSGIGRGLFEPEALDAVHARLEALLADAGLRLAGTYYCPHAPSDGCSCRKPAPGMLLRAAEELDLALDRSWIVGDKASDVEAGRRAGCRGVQLGETAPDLLAASAIIMSDH